MLGISRKHAHFVFSVLQSGLTSEIASGIASLSFLQTGGFLSHWLHAWIVSWIFMLSIVVFVAPAIRRLSLALTREEA